MDEHSEAFALLQRLLAGARLTQAVAVATSLGIPDQLAAGPRTVDELATATDTHPPTLYRLMGTLAAAGVFHEAEGRRFALTAVGYLLRSGVPGSLRDWALQVTRPYVRDAWGNLDHSVRTGENAFTALHGEDVWHWRAHEPFENDLFNRAMVAVTGNVGAAIAEAFDFGSLASLADIGGGSGQLLATILARYPPLQGILFDMPHVVSTDATTEILDRAGVRGRCRIVGGSFFESVPPGIDGYLLKAILHDWEDEPATRILRTIRTAARDDARLLVVDAVLGPPNDDLPGRLLDLHMLVMPGGRERTADEWRGLFAAGGFELSEIRPITPAWRLLVGVPA